MKVTVPILIGFFKISHTSMISKKKTILDSFHHSLESIILYFLNEALNHVFKGTHPCQLQTSCILRHAVRVILEARSIL